MTILEKWGKAIEALDEKSMDECLHDDYPVSYTHLTLPTKA